MCWMYSAESLISWQNFELLRVSFIFRYTFILKCIQLKLNSTWWGKHIIMFYNILFVGFIRSRLFSGLNLKSKTLHSLMWGDVSFAATVGAQVVWRESWKSGGLLLSGVSRPLPWSL